MSMKYIGEMENFLEQLDDYESKLKPCPFCGDRAKINCSASRKGFNAACVNESCSMLVISEECKTLDELVMVWNRRAE